MGEPADLWANSGKDTHCPRYAHQEGEPHKDFFSLLAAHLQLLGDQ